MTQKIQRQTKSCNLAEVFQTVECPKVQNKSKYGSLDVLTLYITFLLFGMLNSCETINVMYCHVISLMVFFVCFPSRCP